MQENLLKNCLNPKIERSFTIIERIHKLGKCYRHSEIV